MKRLNRLSRELKATSIKHTKKVWIIILICFYSSIKLPVWISINLKNKSTFLIFLNVYKIYLQCTFWNFFKLSAIFVYFFKQMQMLQKHFFNLKHFKHPIEISFLRKYSGNILWKILAFSLRLKNKVII